MDKNEANVVLTDGTGVSQITAKKFIKDFVADALLTVAASLAAAGVIGIPTDEATAFVALNAIGVALLKAAYRAVLRWAQED